MSKEAAARAMREARYAEMTARSAAAPTPARPAARAAKAPTAATTGADDAAPPPADGRCGHRSMNGRTCTREAGHAAKSHRYS